MLVHLPGREGPTDDSCGDLIILRVCHVFVHEDIAPEAAWAAVAPSRRAARGMLPALDLPDALVAAHPVRGPR